MGAVVLAKIPLKASTSFTQAKQDRFHDVEPVGGVRGLIYADQAGTLYLEESDDDGATWAEPTATVAVSAGITAKLPWTELTKRWYRFRYANGATTQAKFVLIQQTRGMELDDVQLTGRKLAVIYTDYSQVLNVPAGNNVLITITPPSGELWRVKNLTVQMLAPIGATTGDHKVIIRSVANNDSNRHLYASNAYNASISILANYIYIASTKQPTTEQSQQATILNIVLTNQAPLYLYYVNSTDVAQTGQAIIGVTREVEYIVS